MTDPLARDALPAPPPQPEDISARSFRLLAAGQIAPRKPARRCFLPDLARIAPPPQPENHPLVPPLPPPIRRTRRTPTPTRPAMPAIGPRRRPPASPLAITSPAAPGIARSARPTVGPLPPKPPSCATTASADKEPRP